MQPAKKLYARFVNGDWRTSGKDFEIQNENEAVQHALQARAVCFNTYEATNVNLNGKELTGEPENFSARRYVGIDRVYTRDEAIAVMLAEKPYSSWDAAEFNAITHSIVARFKQKPADTVFMAGLGRLGDFTQVKADEKVFDAKGRQLWPQMSPGLKNTPKP